MRDKRRKPWDQRLAARLARPLASTAITPNECTLVTFLIAAAAALLFASGNAWALHLGAGLFALARFLDHLDGELARQSGRTSRLGYYLDYLAGDGSYALLFLGLGLGLSQDWPGQLAPVAWLGWLTPFLLAASLGALLYCLWTLVVWARLACGNSATLSD